MNLGYTCFHLSNAGMTSHYIQLIGFSVFILVAAVFSRSLNRHTLRYYKFIIVIYINTYYPEYEQKDGNQINEVFPSYRLNAKA